MTDNGLVVAIVGALGTLIAAFLGGFLLLVIAPWLSRFLKTNQPSSAAMAKLAAVGMPAAVPAQRRPLTPTSEPIVIASVAFMAFLVAAALFVSPVPTKEQVIALNGPAEEPPKPAGLPQTKTAADAEKALAALPKGDPAVGKKAFNGVGGCLGCHSQEANKKLVGPSFYGLYTRAATRREGYSAKQYLYESIVNPNAFVVDGYQPNIMNQALSSVLKPEEMAGLLAWIETKHAEK